MGRSAGREGSPSRRADLRPQGERGPAYLDTKGCRRRCQIRVAFERQASELSFRNSRSLAHIDREYDDRIREGIVRALGYSEARQLAWDSVLVALTRLRSRPESGFRDGLMAALAGMARSGDLPVLF